MVEALAEVEEMDGRHWEAEIYRLRSELLLMQDNDAGAEASLHEAVKATRRQSAKSWELRATVSPCRLWQELGKVKEAHKFLADTNKWFA